MKLFVILSVIACGYAAKLDRTYLPPPNAATAGGSPGSLTAPSGFGQSDASGNFGPARQSIFGSSSGSGQAPASENFGPASQGSFGQQQIQPQNNFGAPSQGFVQGSVENQPQFGTSQGSLQNAGTRGSNNFAVSQRFGNEPERPQAAADRTAEILKYVNENDGESYNYSFETSNGIAAEENGVATNGVEAQGGFSYMGDDGQQYSVTYTADQNGFQPQGDHLPTPHPIPEEILKSIEKNSQAAAAGTQEGAYNPEEDNESAPSPQRFSQGLFPAAPSGSAQSAFTPSVSAQSAYTPSGPAQSAFTQSGPAQSAFVPSVSAQSAFTPSVSGQSAYTPSGPAQSVFTQSRLAQSAFAPSVSAQSSIPQSVPSQSEFTPSSSAQSAFNPSRTAQPSFTQLGQGQSSFTQPRADQSGFAPSGQQTAFTPKRPTESASLNQNNRPQSASFRQPASQNIFNTQKQDESGYQYDRPSGIQSSFRGPSQSISPAQGTGAFSNGASQASFATPPRSSFGNLPAAQSFGVRPSSPGQGSFNRQPASPQKYNAANNGFQAGRPSQPSVPQQYRGQQSAASKAPVPEYQSAPNQYNQPKPQGQMISRFGPTSQSGSASQQASGPYNPLATQTFNQAAQGSQGQTFNQASQGQGQAFGGPRQPPSFSAEEGYKY